MMLAAFETLLDRTPPAWVRKYEVAALTGAFAEAFGVEAPDMEPLSADEALSTYREFTAACMETALEDAALAEAYREQLGLSARELGAKVRAIVPVRRESAFRLVRFLYRGIGIELSGEVPGDVRFGPCSFAQRYTPADCYLMSAFDEGFICGVTGVEGKLSFTCRLTEGAASCCARLE